MPALTDDARRQRKEYASLTKHYGRIGPAAIAAALVCAKSKLLKDVKPAPKLATRPA